jgi:hypothetical protein
MSEEKTWFLKIIVPAHSQASYGAKDYAGDLEGAWKKIEKIPGAKAFMGGSTGAHTGFFNFHMARRSADDREEPSPLYPAAAIMFDVGIIVGAHKTATIANAIQGKLSKALESAMAEHEFDMNDWGVFYHYHSNKSSRVDHVWYIECSYAGVQEVVATELKDYKFMLLPDELAGPAEKLKRLCRRRPCAS